LSVLPWFEDSNASEDMDTVCVKNASAFQLCTRSQHTGMTRSQSYTHSHNEFKVSDRVLF